MGDPGQTHSGTAAPQRPTRTALEEPACGLEWHFVGVTDGCSLGGCSGALPAIPDLPSQISAMGSVWNDERSSGSPCHRTKGPRGPGCKRSLHRWELCSSEKGGSKVGKTKRGKGTKIMAVADRHGLPVSVCVESATPHEVKLATSTLVQMIVSEAPQNLDRRQGVRFRQIGHRTSPIRNRTHRSSP
jgi:hypothetical protein